MKPLRRLIADAARDAAVVDRSDACIPAPAVPVGAESAGSGFVVIRVGDAESVLSHDQATSLMAELLTAINRSLRENLS